MRSASGSASRAVSTCSSTSSRAPLNRKSASYSWRAMPGHWLPWPGKTNTVRPPRRTRENAGSAATISAHDDPTNTPRTSWTARPANDAATCVTDSPDDSKSRSRPTNASTDPTDRPETGHATGTPLSTGPLNPVRPEPSTAGTAPSPGTTSRTTTCAFVPEIPNADTPARRTRSPPGHARPCPTTRSESGHTTCREGTSACKDAGIHPHPNANNTFTRPTTPAAACVCPIFDFTDPNQTGPTSGPRIP
jgi:hypothetical protein